ncbi:hypothetical protein TanjilG_03838 [Lupinus angustifolius]|uniref:NADH dehydrogenase [ubiquinone] 1 beta subcomplex subunit 8, mitochondrial n=1 Tax=Lupinus angustifolius TaxID=3871 RepID=A0A1J7HWR7_LUPAN|nr:hypothetical protein TanjilG_03801 [Lupinus angustifolius]OIW06213.1 hypothetical protein TanjilG_03838 [Lupinus angustifolius]
MAGRLTNAASRILGGNGVVSRSVASSLRLRSGMGLPVGKHIVPDKPLPASDELMWDNGTPYPEPCIDRIADTVGKINLLTFILPRDDNVIEPVSTHPSPTESDGKTALFEFGIGTGDFAQLEFTPTCL